MDVEIAQLSVLLRPTKVCNKIGLEKYGSVGGRLSIVTIIDQRSKCSQSFMEKSGGQLQSLSSVKDGGAGCGSS